MKTTIEIKGYLIEINADEEQVVVSASKDDEVVEEFSLNLEGGAQMQDEEEVQGDEIKSFGEFGEEEDFGSQEEVQDEVQDELQDEEEELQDEEEELEEEGALESFQSFVNKRK